MEKRKLKYPYQRMPKEKVKMEQAVQYIHSETGFAKADIKEVMGLLSDFIVNQIVENKSFYLPKVGTIYPIVKPPKNVVKINRFSEKGAEIIPMEARWVCKFKVKPSLADKLLENPPTIDDINNIYVN